MELMIRNMKSSRCVAIVKRELDRQGFGYKNIELGKIELPAPLPDESLRRLDDALKEIGLEVIQNKEKKLVEKIKEALEEFIVLSADNQRTSFPSFISKKLNHNYGVLSNVFFNVEGISIERYIITRKTEYIKNILTQENYTLNEIAYQMGYTSVAHLSNQFKKVTGMSPTKFRQKWLSRCT